MKKLLSIAAATALIFSFANAGGKIVEEAYTPPVPVPTWTGPYIGLKIGYIKGDGDINLKSTNINTTFSPNSFTLKPDGVDGGLYAGYNWESPSGWLFGIEGDFDLMSADEKKSITQTDYPAGIAAGGIRNTNEYKLKQKWDASLRLRVGKVIDDKWMPYITGGITWARLEATYNGNKDSKTATGWTLGAGVEVKFTNNLFGRIQYRYSDYEKEDFSHGNGITSTVDYKSHSIVAGIHYKF
ncbi:MAG: porin family protein [Epsilonproteobacteria bacterium]|nr:porin family protein [Campylobacterota bacterium]